jgi:hypothetical protein
MNALLWDAHHARPHCHCAAARCQAIERQAAAGVAEADSIIMVVDGQAGLTAEDYEIVSWLRKKHPKKPVGNQGWVAAQPASARFSQDQLAWMRQLGGATPRRVPQSQGGALRPIEKGAGCTSTQTTALAAARNACRKGLAPCACWDVW